MMLPYTKHHTDTHIRVGEKKKSARCRHHHRRHYSRNFQNIIYVFCNFKSTAPDFIDFFHHPVIVVWCITPHGTCIMCDPSRFLLNSFSTLYSSLIGCPYLSLYNKNKRFYLFIYSFHFIYGIWCVAAARQMRYCHLGRLLSSSLPLIVMLNVKNGLRFISHAINSSFFFSLSFTLFIFSERSVAGKKHQAIDEKPYALLIW